ncbi:MAG TPA: DUF3667 domain-containing protein [Planctomycetota bacterium]|nr:DUF3667 domain-containing protein [Planctomycetota bacterium]
MSLRGQLARLVHAVSDVDGKLLRTVRELLAHPGALTVAHARGQRTPFLAPFQLFLFANVLFFAIQSLTHTNVFSSTLDSHLHHQDWSTLARQLVERRLQTRAVSLESFAVAFNQAVILHAKALIIAMVVPFAALLTVAFFGTRRPFGIHFVFSLHLYATLLLLFCVGIAAARVSVWFGSAGLESSGVDTVISLLMLLGCAVYLYVSIGRVYGGRPAVRAVRAVLLAVAAAAIVLGYRFALFLLTLYTI